ncbi:DinB superfamily protein [compost metagenome]
MVKQELIAVFIRNHQQAVQYIDGLEDSKFSYRYQDKWTAGEHLAHILLTIIPFPKVLSSKDFIRKQFGSVDRQTWDYETVLHHYAQTSLKAPDAFLPKEEVPYTHKAAIIADIQQHLHDINHLLDSYSEEELDTLVLPHPLLGKLTIREMFYLMAYHPLHHQRQIERVLEMH